MAPEQRRALGSKGGSKGTLGVPRGFAQLTKERRQELAAMGGRATHAAGKAHQFTPAEASATGKKSHAPGNRRKP